MILGLVLLCGGLLFLWKGADVLVSGAVAVASRLGISQLVVGLTVVAMGTSAPEAAASIAAVLSGKGDIAIGNVYGSNIANLALVGGIVALISPLQVQSRTLKGEIPVMLAVSLLLWPILHDLSIGRIEAVALLGCFAALVIFTVRTARTGAPSQAPVEPHLEKTPSHNMKKATLLISVGLVALVAGARITVNGAVMIGDYFNLSDAVIGSTIMAIGTSLPELVTCVVAAVKGHHDISVGNLVGSNIFNTLLVTGVAGTVLPFSIQSRFAGGPDYWIMVGVGVGFALAVFIGKRVVGRFSGALLLAAYGGYLAYLLAFTENPPVAP